MSNNTANLAGSVSVVGELPRELERLPLFARTSANIQVSPPPAPPAEPETSATVDAPASSSTPRQDHTDLMPVSEVRAYYRARVKSRVFQDDVYFIGADPSELTETLSDIGVSANHFIPAQAVTAITPTTIELSQATALKPNSVAIANLGGLFFVRRVKAIAPGAITVVTTEGARLTDALKELVVDGLDLVPANGAKKARHVLGEEAVNFDAKSRLRIKADALDFGVTDGVKTSVRQLELVLNPLDAPGVFSMDLGRGQLRFSPSVTYAVDMDVVASRSIKVATKTPLKYTYQRFSNTILVPVAGPISVPITIALIPRTTVTYSLEIPTSAGVMVKLEGSGGADFKLDGLNATARPNHESKVREVTPVNFRGESQATLRLNVFELKSYLALAGVTGVEGSLALFADAKFRQPLFQTKCGALEIDGGLDAKAGTFAGSQLLSDLDVSKSIPSFGVSWDLYARSVEFPFFHWESGCIDPPPPPATPAPVIPTPIAVSTTSRPPDPRPQPVDTPSPTPKPAVVSPTVTRPPTPSVVSGLVAVHDRLKHWNYLTWNRVDGVSRYLVYWGTQQGVTTGSNLLTPTNTTDYGHTGVVPGSKYFYRVAAEGPGGVGPLSTEVGCVVPPDPPGRPTNVRVHYDSSKRWNYITWNGVPGATSYHVYWGTSGNVSKGSNSMPLTVTTDFGHSGVVSGRSYFYRVAAVNGQGEGDLSSDEASSRVP